MSTKGVKTIFLVELLLPLKTFYFDWRRQNRHFPMAEQIVKPILLQRISKYLPLASRVLLTNTDIVLWWQEHQTLLHFYFIAWCLEFGDVEL